MRRRLEPTGNVCGYTPRRGAPVCGQPPAIHALIIGGPAGTHTRMACALHLDAGRRGSTDEHPAGDDCATSDARWIQRTHRRGDSFCHSISADQQIHNELDSAPA